MWEQWWKKPLDLTRRFPVVLAQGQPLGGPRIVRQSFRPPPQSHLGIGRVNQKSNLGLHPPPTTSEHAQHVTLLLVTPGQRYETVQPWTEMEAHHYCQLLPSPESMRWPSVGLEISRHKEPSGVRLLFSIQVGKEGKTLDSGGKKLDQGREQKFTGRI